MYWTCLMAAALQNPAKQDDPYAWVEPVARRAAERAKLSEEERQKLTASLKEMNRKIDELRKETQARLKDALGEEKYKDVERSLGPALAGERAREMQGMRLAVAEALSNVAIAPGVNVRIFDRIKKELGLDEERIKKVQKLQDECADEQREAFRDLRGLDGYRDAARKTRKKFDRAMEKVRDMLGPEQKEKLEKMLKEPWGWTSTFAPLPEFDRESFNKSLQQALDRAGEFLSEEQRQSLEKLLKDLRDRPLLPGEPLKKQNPK